MNIVVYDLATGAIKRCISCDDWLVSVQVKPGEGYIEHDRVNDDDYHVVDGAVVPI